MKSDHAPTEPHGWASDLVTLREQVGTLLVRSAKDRRAAARHLTLATIAPDGKPQARTVVLRAADQQNATLDVVTEFAVMAFKEK